MGQEKVMKKVWFQLKNREKKMLLEMDDVNLAALDTPNVSVHGFSSWKDGTKHRVGFNTSNIETYDYQETEEESSITVEHTDLQ